MYRMHNTIRFDGKPIYLPGIFGKMMMMKVMKWHETTACGCVRRMCMLCTRRSAQIARRASKRERERMSVEKMANGRSMYVWIVMYAVPVPMFLFVVIASIAFEEEKNDDDRKKKRVKERCLFFSLLSIAAAAITTK
jgi:hypothetical protein